MTNRTSVNNHSNACRMVSHCTNAFDMHSSSEAAYCFPNVWDIHGQKGSQEIHWRHPLAWKRIGCIEIYNRCLSQNPPMKDFPQQCHAEVPFSSVRICLFLKTCSWKQHFFPEHIKMNSFPTPSKHAKQLKAITTVLGFLLFALLFINLISPSISSYSSYPEESPWKEKEICFLSHCPVAGMVGVKPEAVFTTQTN